MSRRRKTFAILVGLAAPLLLVGSGALYNGMKKGQRHAAAEMILRSQRVTDPGSRVGGPSVIQESQRREIYRRAIIAAEKIAVLDQNKRHDGVTPASEYEAFLTESVASAIRRIAQGNALTEGDVLQIVREGAANDW